MANLRHALYFAIASYLFRALDPHFWILACGTLFVLKPNVCVNDDCRPLFPPYAQAYRQK